MLSFPTRFLLIVLLTIHGPALKSIQAFPQPSDGDVTGISDDVVATVDDEITDAATDSPIRDMTTPVIETTTTQKPNNLDIATLILEAWLGLIPSSSSK
ncbi:hypothetical protein JTE90_016671 [Oedothorax gibbosus]|uniref:Uncharacterized protein n=1 Tax=Oedothorax gibbosus TaxID=931172 RepID=A0AAV6V5F7_9ARAC|nr:hypothetical protein JTE90_016671 [Oedothorax gibbosus]